MASITASSISIILDIMHALPIIALSGVSKNRLTALLAKICGIEMRTRLEFLLNFVGNMADLLGC